MARLDSVLDICLILGSAMSIASCVVIDTEWWQTFRLYYYYYYYYSVIYKLKVIIFRPIH